MKTLFCPAKLNISLEVGCRRPDQYHDIASIMLKTNFGDTMQVQVTSHDYQLHGFEVAKDKDLLYRSMIWFQQKTKLSFGLTIYLDKKIPMQAGLGGGSSNAGQLLYFLNEWFGQPIPLQSLIAESATIGADVPFLVSRATTAWVQGIGEQVLPWASRSLWFVLIGGRYTMPTVQAFAALHKQRHSIQLSEEKARLSWQQPINSWDYFNSFEQELSATYPDIKKQKDDLYQAGAHFAQLTGSGSTSFGVFLQPQQAQQALGRLKVLYPFCVMTETWQQDQPL
jgi:4-diphosphocytidyl-2-C-methyl-D-erythritol kinase